jgi:nucleotide sugar dehydrogenase
VVAACLASLGRRVIGLEADAAKLHVLRSGRAPFHEPGLDELVNQGVELGGLRFTEDARQAAEGSNVIFLCVGSPPREDGSVDLLALGEAASSIAPWLHSAQVVVVKSTVPVGTNRWLRELMDTVSGPGSGRMSSVVSNPEFLRQGSAVQDFLHPDRIVLGGDDPVAVDLVTEVYGPILDQRFPGGDESRQPPLVRTTPAAAEAAKYASNAFLAAKISFINEMANICDRLGADVAEVATAMGLDHRIGPDFLQAGVGWGGSCFAKDLAGLIVAARRSGYEPQLLEAVRDVNERQRDTVIAKLRCHLNLEDARVALLGLAFKPGTDDLRGAPSVGLARGLMEFGTAITAFDPVVPSLPGMPEVIVVRDPYEAAVGADAVVLVTEWPELRELDLEALRARMHGNVLVDGRNAVDPDAAARAGFAYEGIGRGKNAGQAGGRGLAEPAAFSARWAP